MRIVLCTLLHSGQTQLNAPCTQLLDLASLPGALRLETIDHDTDALMSQMATASSQLLGLLATVASSSHMAGYFGTLAAA